MKAKGIVRRIDELGRIVIPKEMREMHGIKNNDTVEIVSDGNKITVTKFLPGCSICSKDEELVDFDDKKLCRGCIEKIKQVF